MTALTVTTQESSRQNPEHSIEYCLQSADSIST